MNFILKMLGAAVVALVGAKAIHLLYDRLLHRSERYLTIEYLEKPDRLSDRVLFFGFAFVFPQTR